MKKFAAISALVLATGCTGVNYAMENYSDVDVQQIKHEDKEWRIFDKPEEGRLMITPAFGDTMGAGMASGITFGLATSPYIRGATFRPAAQAYLAQTHGRCTITGGDLVIEPQYEFFYQC